MHIPKTHLPLWRGLTSCWRRPVAGGLVRAVMGLMLALPGLGADAGTLPVIKACGHHAYPPWNWQRGGHIVGTCADLAREALRSAGYDIDLKFVGPWPRCQKLLESGQVDVNICALDSQARRAYSVPIAPAMARNDIALFHLADRPSPLTQPEDLKGLRVAVVRGVSFGDSLDTQLRRNAQLQHTADDRQSFFMLLLGRVDAVVTGQELGQLTLMQMNCQNHVVAAPKALVQADLHLFVTKQSPLMASLPLLEKFFEDRKRHGLDTEDLQAKYRAEYIAQAQDSNREQTSQPCHWRNEKKSAPRP